MRSQVTLVVLIASVASCATLRANRVQAMETKVEQIESTPPDTEALGRGDTRTTYRQITEMAAWISQLERDGAMAPIDRTRLADRVRAARTKFRFVAAAIAQPPDVGFAIATEPIAYSEPTDAKALSRPEYLTIVRQLADARAASRQTQVREAHTYANRNTRGDVGNCVVSSQPFGGESAVNPGLTFRPRAGQLSYVRCYVRVSLRSLPKRDGRFFGGGVLMASPPQFDLDHVDFAIRFAERKPTPRKLELRYEYTHDNIVVWENGGRRVRADRRSVVLARSPVLIDTSDQEIARR